MSTQLSIIICTYDRYDMLPVALNSLAEECARSSLKAEILVIDNTPAEKRKPIPAFDGFKVLVSDRPGLSNARNIGIQNTRGEVIAFLDDDAEVLPGYLDALVGGFDQNESALAIGGCTKPVFPFDRPVWFSDSLLGYLSCIDLGTECRPLTKGEFVVGANVAFRRDVFRSFGLFDANLGRNGSKTLMSNEETSLMNAIGHDKVFYNPKQIVLHHIPPDRLKPDWFRRRVFWQGISDIVGDMRYITRDAVLEEFGALQLRLPPEDRGLGFLVKTPQTSDQFSAQLQLIYLLTMLGSDGFAAVAGSGDV